MTLDRWDALALLGIVLLGGGMWGLGGPYLLLSYAGVILLLIGITGARRTRRA